MTAEEALHIQEVLEKRGIIHIYYGTHCRKCCGVYPRLMKKDTTSTKDCYYQCEVCGKRTDLYTMPWLAEEAWNEGRYESDYRQMSLW